MKSTNYYSESEVTMEYIYTFKKDKKTLMGSSEYIGKVLGVKSKSVTSHVWQREKGKFLKLKGWTYIEKHIFMISEPNESDKPSAVSLLDYCWIRNEDKMVEGRYKLRTGKKERNCLQCAFYYDDKRCSKYNGLCGDDGVFKDFGAPETRYDISV